MSGMTTVITTKTIGSSEIVVLTRYGDGTIDFSIKTVTSVGTTSGSPNLASVVSTLGLFAGCPISGTGIPAGTTVLSFVVNTSIVMSANATATATVNATYTKNRSGKAKRYQDGDPGFVKGLFTALAATA